MDDFSLVVDDTLFEARVSIEEARPVTFHRHEGKFSVDLEGHQV